MTDNDFVNLPRGVGVLAFMLPGSAEPMDANVVSLRDHRSSSGASTASRPAPASPRRGRSTGLSTRRTAARYVYMDLLAGKRAEGLSLDEMREAAAAFDVRTTVA
jgi:rhamnulose-1-phosphate aldolase